MFLGSAPDQPFDPERYRNWRWFWDFGGGSLTDLFLHWVDVAHWCMASDTPIDAQAMGGKYVIPELQWPDTVSAAFHYPGNFLVNFDCSLMGYLEGGGLVFHGTKALMRLHRGGFAVYPEQPRYTELPDLKDVAQEVHSAHDGAHRARAELPRLHPLAQYAECAGRGGRRGGARRTPGQSGVAQRPDCTGGAA